MTKPHSTNRIYTIVDADEDVEAYAFTDIDVYLQEWNDLMDTNYETIKQFNATETNYHIYVSQPRERMTKAELMLVEDALLKASNCVEFAGDIETEKRIDIALDLINKQINRCK